MIKLFVRLFAEASASEALELAQRLREHLEAVAAEAHVKLVRPYWKIPEYHEICLNVSVFGGGRQAVSVVTSRLGHGWILAGDREAIWNPSTKSSFEEPLVRWAHVEVQD